MSKGKAPSCSYCKRKIIDEEGILHSKKRYHENCYQEMMEIRKDRKDLIEYICKIHNIETPTGMILKQIKDFTDPEQYGYKLKGIRLALEYFYETLGNQVREGDGIGIVPYVYEEAKKHYIMKMKVQQSVEEYQVNKEPNVVEIESPKFEYKRKIKQIDITSL